ncbi:MAG: carbonic anhydrase [Candidatus Bilamarchaeaceae archaeon]
MNVERLQNGRAAEAMGKIGRSSSAYNNAWMALGGPLVESLNAGQNPRVMAVGPAVIGGLKRIYGEDFGRDGRPGKVFEVTCRNDGTLDAEGLGSVYYGVRHLGIKKIEAWGRDLATAEKTIGLLLGANIEGIWNVEIRAGALLGSKINNLENADAGLLCCSDSRVHPYQIFEEGKVVVVSNAGNTLSPVAVETFSKLIEMGVPVLAVLGHSRCGAVAAAIEGAPEPMLAETIRKVRANISTTSSQSRIGKEMRNALVAYSMLGGNGGAYGNEDMSARLQELVREKGVLRAAYFFNLTDGKVSKIPQSLG